MKHDVCEQVQSSLRQPSGTKTLELIRKHIAECADCAEVALLPALQRAAQRGSARIAMNVESARSAVQTALAEFERDPNRESVLRTDHGAGSTRVRWIAPLAVAAAAVLLLLWRFEATEPRAVPAPVQAVAVEKTEVHPQTNGPVPTKDEVTAHLSLDPGASSSLAHARLTAVRPSILDWDPAASTARLVRGEVDVQVDPKPKQAFRVATSQFVVEVLGTRFRVSERSVSVTEGHVRVLPANSSEPAELGPGQSWSKAEQTSSRKPASTPPSVLLKQARSRLAGGDWRTAQDLVNRALAQRPSGAERDEANALLAECALVRGDKGEAAELYGQAAHSAGSTDAAEDAHYARARLQAEAGNARQARALLQQYLTKYPNGRYARQARLRLEALGKD